MSTDCPLGVVAVHLGAGYHSVRETPVYARACRAALREGVARLRAGCSAREAACAAVAALENAPCTNAGTGSNLTLGGDVECDAAVMDGQTRLFSAVGAVSSVRNPVLAARALLEQQQAGPMTLGRVPPAVLVGRGAERWAQQHGVPGVDRKKLVTEKSAANYRRYMERLAAAEQRKRQKGRPDSLKRGVAPQQGQGAGKRLCVGKGTQSRGVGNVLQGTTKKGELGRGQGDRSVLQETTKDVVHVLVQGQWDCNILEGAAEEGGSFQGEGDGNFFCQNLGRKRGRNLLNNEIMSDVTGEAPTCVSSGNGIPNGAGRFDQEEQSLVDQEEQSLVDQSESAVQDRSDADIRLDTVGAVAMDMHGNVSGAVSSGGLALKQPGRLGHAAMYGCGCWAVQESPLSVACSTTGCGEHIMQTMLARECAESILQGDETNASLDRALKSKFLHSRFLRNVDKKVGGAILLRCEEVRGESEPAVELLWGHTADSMCVGFMSTHHDRPQVRMSRLPAGQRSGQAVVTEGCFVR